MNIKHHIALLAACVLATGVISCKTESDDVREKVAPGQVTWAEYTPTNGGAWIKYGAPADEDFLYVRAEYTLDNGQVISRSSSVYTDSLSISGFGSVKPYDVKLYSCDYFANESEPYTLSVTPMEPNVVAVAATLTPRKGFAGIVVELQNPAMESVDVYVDIEAQDGSGRKATRIFTSKLAEDKLMITDLEAIPYSVKMHVRDQYDNATEVVDYGSITPMTDYELAKDTWSFLSDDLLYGSYWAGSKPDAEHLGMYSLDSMKNAMEYRYDGSIHKFWDGVTDTGEDRKKGMNSFFHSGFTENGGYPFSYFINMGRKIKISRMRVWQRYDYLYKQYGPKTFDIWISNDSTPADGILSDWELVGRYTIEKASTDAEAMQEAIDGHEFWMYPADVDFTREFQYLRFKCITDFNGKGTIGCLAELTLYGEDC